MFCLGDSACELRMTAIERTDAMLCWNGVFQEHAELNRTDEEIVLIKIMQTLHFGEFRELSLFIMHTCKHIHTKRKRILHTVAFTHFHHHLLHLHFSITDKCVCVSEWECQKPYEKWIVWLFGSNNWRSFHMSVGLYIYQCNSNIKLENISAYLNMDLWALKFSDSSFHATFQMYFK